MMGPVSLVLHRLSLYVFSYTLCAHYVSFLHEHSSENVARWDVNSATRGQPSMMGLNGLHMHIDNCFLL
jgi:hypothetical protein